MVRRRYCKGIEPYGFPHARGDGPRTKFILIILDGFSPRTWGWSVEVVRIGRDRQVFPTHVGMVRLSMDGFIITVRFPHARGDGPRWAS